MLSRKLKYPVSLLDSDYHDSLECTVVAGGDSVHVYHRQPAQGSSWSQRWIWEATKTNQSEDLSAYAVTDLTVHRSQSSRRIFALLLGGCIW